MTRSLSRLALVAFLILAPPMAVPATAGCPSGLFGVRKARHPGLLAPRWCGPPTTAAVPIPSPRSGPYSPPIPMPAIPPCGPGGCRR